MRRLVADRDVAASCSLSRLVVPLCSDSLTKNIGHCPVEQRQGRPQGCVVALNATPVEAASTVAGALVIPLAGRPGPGSGIQQPRLHTCSSPSSLHLTNSSPAACSSSCIWLHRSPSRPERVILQRPSGKIMPSVAQESPTVQSSKKRRRDDDALAQNPLYEYATLSAPFRPSSTTNHSIASSYVDNNTPRLLFPAKTLDHGALLSYQQQHPSPSIPRKIIPLPPGKRQRTLADDICIDFDGEPMQRSPISSPAQRRDRPEDRQHHPRSKEALGDKSRAAGPNPIPEAPAKSLMLRCHICFRKPTKKTDLDSFADCLGCGERTCYVCIRECLGWALNLPPAEPKTLGPNSHPPPSLDAGETSFTMLDADADDHTPPPPAAVERTTHEHGWTRGGGHRRVVCSRCCVERGQDGEVVCLGCLPFVEG